MNAPTVTYIYIYGYSNNIMIFYNLFDLWLMWLLGFAHTTVVVFCGYLIFSWTPRFMILKHSKIDRFKTDSASLIGMLSYFVFVLEYVHYKIKISALHYLTDIIKTTRNVIFRPNENENYFRNIACGQHINYI